MKKGSVASTKFNRFQLIKFICHKINSIENQHFSYLSDSIFLKEKQQNRQMRQNHVNVLSIIICNYQRIFLRVEFYCASVRKFFRITEFAIICECFMTFIFEHCDNISVGTISIGMLIYYFIKSICIPDFMTKATSNDFVISMIL